MPRLNLSIRVGAVLIRSVALSGSPGFPLMSPSVPAAWGLKCVTNFFKRRHELTLHPR